MNLHPDSPQQDSRSHPRARRHPGSIWLNKVERSALIVVFILIATGGLLRSSYAWLYDEVPIYDNAVGTVSLTAPTDLAANYVSADDKIGLTWSPAQNSRPDLEYTYKIYRGTVDEGSLAACQGAQYDLLHQTEPVDDLLYDDYSGDPDTWYCYKVQTTYMEWYSGDYSIPAYAYWDVGFMEMRVFPPDFESLDFEDDGADELRIEQSDDELIDGELMAEEPLTEEPEETAADEETPPLDDPDPAEHAAPIIDDGDTPVTAEN